MSVDVASVAKRVIDWHGTAPPLTLQQQEALAMARVVRQVEVVLRKTFINKHGYREMHDEAALLDEMDNLAALLRPGAR